MEFPDKQTWLETAKFIGIMAIVIFIFLACASTF